MNTTRLSQVRRLFCSGNRAQDRHNRLAWVRSLRILGDKWLLASPINKSVNR